MDMLIAYGIHRGGGAGSCDVRTKISVVNGVTGNLKSLKKNRKILDFDCTES